MKSKKGITLVELIVAMALTVLLLTASTAFVVPMYSYYADSVTQSRAIKVSANIEKRLKEVLPSAANVYVSRNATISHSGADAFYLFIQNGAIVYRKNSTVEEFLLAVDYEGFAVNWIIKVRYKGSESTRFTMLEFTMTLTKGEVTITRKTTINFPNMQMNINYKITQLDGTLAESTEFKSLKFTKPQI